MRALLRDFAKGTERNCRSRAAFNAFKRDRPDIVDAEYKLPFDGHFALRLGPRGRVLVESLCLRRPLLTGQFGVGEPLTENVG